MRGSNWRWLAAGAVVLVLVVGFFLFRNPSGNVAGTAPPPVAGAAQTATTPSATPKAPTAAEAGVATPSPLRFVRFNTDLSGAQPEACLGFSEALSTDAATHYEDYVKFNPAVRPALRVQGDRICISGLRLEPTYTVKLLAGLPAASGNKLTEPEEVKVTFGDRPAVVSFVGNGLVLPRHRAAGVAIETVNVNELQIDVYRVGDRILARSEIARSKEGEDYYADYAERQSPIRTKVWSGRMKVKGERNQSTTTAFPLANVLKERKPGAHLVVARPYKPDDKTAVASADDGESEGDYSSSGGSAKLWVIDTDLGLAAYRGNDGLTVTVRSLETAKPVAGVQLKLIAVGNDELGVATTDADGRAAFNAGMLRGTGAQAAKMVMAYRGAEDFAVLDLDRPAFDLSDRGVSGRAQPGPVDGFLYTERGIYRPGETVQLGALLRDDVGMALAKTQVSLVLRRPDGVVAARQRLTANDAGIGAASFPISRTASRGMWSVTASLDGGERQIAKVEFDVQDFVPQRLRVKATTEAKVVQLNQPVTVEVDGQFLYGAPAADSAAEGTVKLVADPTPFPDRREWRFGMIDDKFEEKTDELKLDPTDKEGRTRATVLLSELPQTTLPVRADISLGVLEPGGRVTRDQIQLPVETKKLLLGIRPRFDNGQVRENGVAAFELVALDRAGKPVPAAAVEYSFFEEDWSYDWYQTGGRWQYQRVVRDRLLSDGKVTLAADKPAELKIGIKWGRYRLVTTDPASGAKTSIRFRAGYGATTERDTPDKIDVALLNGAGLKQGDTAEIRIVPPAAGEVQIAVATDKVLEMRTVHVTPEGTVIKIKTDERWGAGAYVLATLFRPLAETGPREPARSIGLVHVPMDMAARTLDVAIDAPATARPRGKFDVAVTVKGAASGTRANVTLAAVDEGILQLTRFQTPDPVGWYFGKRRLGVDLRDDYGRLLDGRLGVVGEIREGGDAMGGAGLTVVPTKTVAIFSGVLTVDGNGKVTVPLEIPDWVGELRLMAVAVTPNAVGRGEARVKVRDPVVAELSFPRFIAPGDEARMTLSLDNVEGAAGGYRVRVRTEGAVSLPAAVDETIELAAGNRQVRTYAFAGGDPGIGTISLDLSGPGGLQLSRSWQIESRTPFYPLVVSNVGAQAAGVTYTLPTGLLDPFVAGTGSVEVNYSAVPGIDVPGLLRDLARYPYGCTEQLVSVAFPQLFFEEVGTRLAVLPVKAGAAPASADQLRAGIQEAIGKIIDRQGPDGAFGLWVAGDASVPPFLGAYVADFLLRAKERGFVVPDAAIEGAIRSLRSLAQQQSSWRSWNSERNFEKTARSDGAAYALYLLTKLQQGDVGSLRYFLDNDLSKTGTALAAAQIGAALAMAGDRVRADKAFDAAASRLADAKFDPSRSYYYATRTREQAAVLSVLSEAGETKRTEPMLKALLQADLRPERLMTQEKAWLLFAAQALTARAGELKIVANDRVPASAAPRGPLSFTPAPDELKAGYKLQNQGGGEVWRNMVVRGVPKTAPPAFGNGAQLTKTWHRLDGTVADPTSVQQNDRFVVELTGSFQGGAYRQVMLVDMLPAGFEIEGPVSQNGDQQSPAYPWLRTLTRTRMREARDDRYVTALDLNWNGSSERYDDEDSSKKKDFEKMAANMFRTAYVVRAITPGKFILPGAISEDLYRPGVGARTVGGTTEVRGR